MQHSPLCISLQNPLPCQQFPSQQPEHCGQEGSCNFPCSAEELPTWIQLVGDTPGHLAVFSVSVPDFGLAVFEAQASNFTGSGWRPVRHRHTEMGSTASSCCATAAQPT